MKPYIIVNLVMLHVAVGRKPHLQKQDIFQENEKNFHILQLTNIQFRNFRSYFDDILYSTLRKVTAFSPNGQSWVRVEEKTTPF